MKWRKLLHVPKKLHRARSEARSEIGSIEGQGGVDLTVPRRSESTPDLQIDTSALPTSSPFVSRDQESNGTQTGLSQTIHLIALFTQHRPLHRLRPNPVRFRKRPKHPPGIFRSHRQTRYRIREQIRLEVHRVCYHQASHQYGEGILGRLSPSQVCCRRPLGHPKSLRGMAHLPYATRSGMLTVIPENRDMSPNDRSVDTPG